MFGTKLRTWMEAHIVRPKKKKDRKKLEKGFESNYCNSPGGHSASKSPGLHQVHPLSTTAKNVDTIVISNSTKKYPNNNNNNNNNINNTNTSSINSGGTGSVNLSSPESAYSTGYSTDGTSPGASYPPEYYINIRTGTHYFQSNKTKTGTKKIPITDTSVLNDTDDKKFHSNMVNNNATITKEKKLLYELKNNIPLKNTEMMMNNVLKQPGYHKNFDNYKNDYQEHRRSESYTSTNISFAMNSLAVPSSIPPPLITRPLVQSPRQRSRIRTNPWLSANSSGSSTNGGGGGGDRGGGGGGQSGSNGDADGGGKFKSHHNLNDDTSGSTSDVNVYNHRNASVGGRDYRLESLSVGRSPINKNSWRMSPRMEMRSSRPLLRRSSSSDCSSSSSSVSSITQSIRSSEDDDITLNEMMGKFDESYVYEKETDILSDSDPTDCEDYVNHSPSSDVDTGQDGGDENDPFENDNDFDYIDNGSFIDLNNLEPGFSNTGHCTYFTITSELTRRSTRLRESILKRRCKEDLQHRTMNARSNSKRLSIRHKKQEEKANDKSKKRQSQRRKQINDKSNEVTANLNRVLVERMLLKNSGFNQGSRSVGGTPICLRRRKHHDINENISPLHQNSDPRNFITPSIIDNEIIKRRSNSISYVNGNLVKHRASENSYMTTFASELALIEADKEADRKYRELILEAENILVNMKNSTSIVIPSPSKRTHNGLANKRVELIKNAELNIEFALSKSRNSQPELQCGSIKDLEHTSPKRLIEKTNQYYSPNRRLLERNSGCFSRENGNYRSEIKCPDSPVMARRISQVSPIRNSLQNHLVLEENDRSRSRTVLSNGNCFRSFSQDRNNQGNFLINGNYLGSGAQNLNVQNGVRAKEDTPTSSSSESDDTRGKAPLMTFRSVDMGPIKESSYYCPQSEPVKRKVYAGSATYGRIKKTLGEKHVILRNSDGDTATDDTDDSRRSLKEKIAQLRQERIEADNTNSNVQDNNQSYQQHLTQLRRQMLMHTIEGLKRSLEDQSATLKQTCLKETVLHH